MGHFKDQFKEDILERDVMPWLMSAAQDQLDRLNGHKQYPTTLVNNYLDTRGQRHTDKVKQYKDMI